MFWRMLKGALVRQSRKMFLVAITLALGVSLTTAMLNVMLDVGDKVNRELKAYGANITVTPRSASVLQELYGLETGTGATGQYLQESDVGKIKTIFWANNIVALAPEIEAQASLDTGNVALVGTWFNKQLDLPTGEQVETGIRQLKSWWSVEGDWVDDRETNSAMLGKALAEKLGVRPGDTLKLTVNGAPWELVVQGVFSAGGPEDNQVFAPLAFVQKALNAPGKIGKIEVSAITTPENELAERAAHDPKSLSLKEWETWYCTAYVSAISYQIEEVVTDSRAKPVRQVAESEGTILEKTQLLMLLITVLSLAGSVLGISNLLIANVMERSREFGLLKALGASNSAVVGLTLTEFMVTGFVGGLGGYFLGIGFAKIIGTTVFGTAVAVNAMVIPWVVILAIIVILLGSLPAIRMLLSVRPAAVLNGR